MTEKNELIFAKSNGTLSFGDYTLEVKTKADNFNVNGDIFKVKTYKEITKLECNEIFVYESVPGTAVDDFTKEKGNVSFSVKGIGDVQITLGLEPETEYEVFINKESVGFMETNLGGKLSISVEVSETEPVLVSVVQ